jgi:HEAT repeat protein
MVKKRLSKAAKAAMKASGVEPSARLSTGIDVLARLSEIDPSFSTARENRFSAQIARGPAAVEAVLGQLGADDPEARADAAEALGVLGDKRALSALRERLQDGDGEVRTNAAVALIRIGDEQLFPEVVKALRHEDPRVVIGAAVALGRLADKRVVPNLVEAFKTENPEVGAAVAWALGQCKDAAALPWLTTAVEQGFAVANACEALGRIADPKAQAALLKATTHAADDVRAYAARALGLLKHEGGESTAGARAGQLASHRATPRLRELLQDRSRKVRLCAAIALYELGEKLGGEALVQELQGA